MDLSIGTLITLKDKQYIILETIDENNKQYIFTNEVIDEENITEDYYIFEVINNNEIKLVTDKYLINLLLPKIKTKLKQTIKKFI